MKPNVVKKKAKHIKELLSEYGIISATIKHITQDIKLSGDIQSDKQVARYLYNLKKRLVAIEEDFDHLLK